jgi:hypothetical protein
LPGVDGIAKPLQVACPEMATLSMYPQNGRPPAPTVTSAPIETTLFAIDAVSPSPGTPSPQFFHVEGAFQSAGWSAVPVCATHEFPARKEKDTSRASAIGANACFTGLLNVEP